MRSINSEANVDGTALQGVAYSYSVRAVDAAGNRGAAATASATVPDVTAPSAPPSISGQSLTGPTRIRISWAAASDNAAVTGYRVYRNGVLLASTSSLAYVDYAVAKKTSYSYAVRAMDSAGNVGPSSATITIKTR